MRPGKITCTYSIACAECPAAQELERKSYNAAAHHAVMLGWSRLPKRTGWLCPKCAAKPVHIPTAAIVPFVTNPRSS